MTFDALETSSHDGNPVELYEFRSGVITWRYTSADEAITYNGQSYAPVAISRGKISASAELNKSGLDIQVTRDNPVAQLFQQQPPGTVVSVTIFKLHRSDGTAVTLWMGRILSVNWPGLTTTLRSESIATSVKRMGLRRKYNLGCPHVLYGPGCYVNQLSYKVTGPVAAISGNQITVAAAGGQADGYYNGGFVYWQTGAGVIDYRMIDSHAASVLTLMFPVNGLALGDSVDIYPGCNRTMSECDSKFGNSDNYGGWPFQPNVNPFNGTSLF